MNVSIKLDEAFFDKVDITSLPNVDAIIQDVKENKDSAIIKYCNEFGDGNFNSGEEFIVSEEEIKDAMNSLNGELKKAIQQSIKNVRNFAKKQKSCIKEFKSHIPFRPFSYLGHKIIPIESVLVYVPGGNYPLVSSAIMGVIPARVAGVKNIYVTSPKITKEVIAAAHMAGADKIFKIGGAQSIAGFAYGSENIPKVDKIVGPGNKYVTYAKKQVYGECGIDFLAGPSEVLIIADDEAAPEVIACDILAQCEHDVNARAYLICETEGFAYKIRKYAEKHLESLSEIARQSFDKSICYVTKDINEIIDIVNKKAPEHLELCSEAAVKNKDKFKNYGSMFIEQSGGEVYGDYCSGTNHVLPTNQVAKYKGGLSVFDFLKIQTYQKIDKGYAKVLTKTASVLAKAEGLEAHKMASDIRSTEYEENKRLNRIVDFFKRTKTFIFRTLIDAAFQLHRRAYIARNVNYPKEQCIFAIWHAHQCGIYSIEDRQKTNVMVSKSRDGDMIDYAVKRLDFKTVRGSKTRGGTSATLDLIDKLKQGDNGVLMIDGPKGPKYVVKKGIVEISRISGVPIVPMAFYCGKGGWLEFNSWDKFRYPIPFRKSLTLYGDPIYVPNNADDETIEKYRKQVEDELFRLQDEAEKNYKELVKLAEEKK